MGNFNQITIDETREMLEYIDAAKLPYSEWVRVGMAINSEFTGADGLALWDEWSASDPGRYKDGECASKWQGFKPTPDGVTIATVIEYAKDGGYTLKKSVRDKWSGNYGWNDILGVNDDPVPLKITEEQATAARAPKEIKKETKKPGQDTKTEGEKTELDKKVERMIKAIDAKMQDGSEAPGAFKDRIEKAITDREGSTFDAYLNFRGFTDEDIKYLLNLEYAPMLGYVSGYDYYSKKRKQWDTMQNALLIAETYDGYSVRNMGEGDRYMNGSRKKGNLVIPTGITAVAADPHKRNEETGYLEPIFIVEGYIDAPSIMAVGYDAIALNGTESNDAFIRLLEHYDVTRPLILALDDDKEKKINSGQKNQKKLAEALEKAGFEYYEIPGFYRDYNDANNFFAKNRAEFEKSLQDARAFVFEQIYKDLGYNISQQQGFEEELIRRALNPAIPTGFEMLDSPLYLDGGLRPALYVIGAISSLGKTTFVLQIADEIAKSGQDVIIFSLEMSKYELMGKSVSRYTFEKDYEPQSLTDIYRKYTRDPGLSIGKSITEYFKDTGEHLRILEGFAETDIYRIRQEVIRHIDRTGRKPVIFVDYLQILLPPRDPQTRRRQNMTDKQKNDYNITELKRLSRDFDVPVFVISSFNRDNYNEPVSMKSFKETGGIEYSSDVLMGLQPSYLMVKDAADREKLKEAYYERWIETKTRIVNLTILKNRHGWVDNSIMYLYVPKYNHYEEYMKGSEYLSSLGIERKKWRAKKNKGAKNKGGNEAEPQPITIV